MKLLQLCSMLIITMSIEGYDYETSNPPLHTRDTKLYEEKAQCKRGSYANSSIKDRVCSKEQAY